MPFTISEIINNILRILDTLEKTKQSDIINTTEDILSKEVSSHLANASYEDALPGADR